MVIRYAPAGGEGPAHARAAVPPPRPQAAAPPSASPPLRRALPLGALLLALVRRLPAMLLVAALPLALAFAWLRLAPPRYEATAVVFVDAAAGRPARAPGGHDPAALDAYVRLASARPVLERALSRDRLAADPAVQTRPTGVAALTALLLDLVGGARPAEDRAGALLRQLTETTRARATGEANLIEISVSSPDAATAARLANAVAGAFVEEVMLTASRAAGLDQSRQSRQAEELRTRLREAEAQLARFRAAGGGSDPATELGRARSQASEAKARYDQVMKLLQGGKQVEAIADLVRSPAIDRLRIQYNEAAAQEATFRTSLGPKHPSYLEAQAQVNEKRRLLVEALRLAAAAARADWQSAQGQEAALEKRLAPPDQPDAAPAPDKAKLDDLERAVELARIAYDRHLRTLSGSADAVDGVPARVISAAVPPAAPVAPSERQVMLLAGLAAAGLALLVGLGGIIREMRRQRPYRPEFRPVQPDQPDDEPPPLPAAAGVVRAPPAASAPPPMPAAAAPAPSAPPAAGIIAAPELAREIAGRSGAFALQTVLVAADRQADLAALALDIATAAAAENLRVLLIDAAEANPVLSEVLRRALLVGRVRIHGRARVLASFEAMPARPIWFVPAEQALASEPPAGGRELPGLAGNFDCVVLAGPEGRAVQGQLALAQAAQIVAVMTQGNGVPDAAGWAGSLGLSGESIRLVTLPLSRGHPSEGAAAAQGA